MIPDCFEGQSLNVFMTEAQLNKIIVIGGIKFGSFLQKVKREGSPVKVFRDVKGIRRYKISHIIAKANARAESIESVRVFEERKMRYSFYGMNYKKVKKSDYPAYEMCYQDISCKLTGHKIQGASAIIDASKHFNPDSCTGVYFLIKQCEIVYVGQSVNVFNRIGNHRGIKDFDAFSYIECPKNQLDVLESIYIHFLNPKYNGMSGTSNRVSAPLPFEEILNRIEVRA